MDKRAHQRSRSVELIKLIDIHPQAPTVTNVHDISRSGVSFYLARKVELAKRLSVVLHIPKIDQQIQVEIQVVRIQRQKKGHAVFKIGAKFKELTEDDWQRLRPGLGGEK